MNILKDAKWFSFKNILLLVMTFLVGFSLCFGLSLKKSVDEAKEEMPIYSSIEMDINPLLNKIDNKDYFGIIQYALKLYGGNVSLGDYVEYGKSSLVKDFYYTETAYLSGSENFKSFKLENANENKETLGGFFKELAEIIHEEKGNFNVIAYSSNEPLLSLIGGKNALKEGNVFSNEGDNECIISEALANANNVKVGDTIKLTNPKNRDEFYNLKVVGLYVNSVQNILDSAEIKDRNININLLNNIYVSSKSLKQMISANSSSLNTNLKPYYLFENIENYNLFKDEIRTKGLPADYVLASPSTIAIMPLDFVDNYLDDLVIKIIIASLVGFILVALVYGLMSRKEIKFLFNTGMPKAKINNRLMLISQIIIILAMLLGSIAGVIGLDYGEKNVGEYIVDASNVLEITKESADGFSIESLLDGNLINTLENAGVDANDVAALIKTIYAGANPLGWIDNLDFGINGIIILELVGSTLLMLLIISLFIIPFTKQKKLNK